MFRRSRFLEHRLWCCLGLCGLSYGLLAANSAHSAEPKKVALLVGVNKYLKAGLRDLSYPEADVDAVGTQLTKLGFKVTVLKGSSNGPLQATKENIERTANSLVKPLGKEDIMLVMLSGHGTQLEVINADKKKREDGFFCPVEAVVSQPETLYSLSHLTDDILAPNVGMKLVLIDACRSVPSDPARDAKGIQGKVITLPENTAVLFGCRAGQQSFESAKLGHGLFTHCLLEGLQGAASKGGKLTWTNLAGYVEGRLSDDDMKSLMPKERLQEPIAAGGVGQLVLAKIDVKETGGTAGANSAKDKPVKSDKVITNNMNMKLALIPKGEFLMGSPESETERSANEKQHRVKITKPFYMGVYPVTQDEYEKVMGVNPSCFSPIGTHKNRLVGVDTKQFPVEQVSWDDAVEFCRKLSKAEGKTYRLPTEAEWEYACRAGTTTPFYFGNTLNGDKANCDGSVPYGTTVKGQYLIRPAPVGSYEKNAFGLYDMCGNMCQWCSDWYDREYGGTSPIDDPQGPKVGVSRVYRGGDWSSTGVNCRAASRSLANPDTRSLIRGFRLVLVP